MVAWRGALRAVAQMNYVVPDSRQASFLEGAESSGEAEPSSNGTLSGTGRTFSLSAASVENVW